MKVAALFCLRCGSQMLDINNWQMGTKTAEVRCSRCGNKGFIQGFTIGRIELSKDQFIEAHGDRAIPWWLKEQEG